MIGMSLVRCPGGRVRWSSVGVAVVASQWLLAATRIGALVGLPPLASAARLGPALGWHAVNLGLDRVDWVLLLAALPLAALLVDADRAG